MSAGSPSHKRQALLRKMCYDWIRKYCRVQFSRFKLITEIEFPKKAHRGRGRA